LIEFVDGAGAAAGVEGIEVTGECSVCEKRDGEDDESATTETHGYSFHAKNQ
jgi:hypothetical protein